MFLIVALALAAQDPIEPLEQEGAAPTASVPSAPSSPSASVSSAPPVASPLPDAKKRPRGNGGVTAMAIGGTAAVVAASTCGGLWAGSQLLTGDLATLSALSCAAAPVLPGLMLGTSLYFAPEAENIGASEELTPESPERASKRMTVAWGTAGASIPAAAIGASLGCLVPTLFFGETISGDNFVIFEFSDAAKIGIGVGAATGVLAVGAAGTLLSSSMLAPDESAPQQY